MNIKKLLPWLPSVLSISLTLLLFAFLFQFTPEGSAWPHFMYALIPGLIALLFAVLAWFLPKPGGIVYVVAGIAYAILMWSKVAVTAIGILSGISVVTGILYFLQKDDDEIEEKSKKIQGTIVSLTKEPGVPVEELATVQPKELPPLPPKIDRPTIIEEAEVDYKEPVFFDATQVIPEEKSSIVESKLLEPQPPKIEMEEALLPKESLDILSTSKPTPQPIEEDLILPALEKRSEDITSSEEPAAKLPPLSELTKDELKDDAPEIPIITHETPPTIEVFKSTETKEASATPILTETPLEVPTTVSSGLEYPEETTAVPATITDAPTSKLTDDDAFQLPPEIAEKTPAPWKSTEPATDAIAQSKDDAINMTPDLPQVSLTNKGASQSGDLLAKTKPTGSGVSSDFLQWANKD